MELFYATRDGQSRRIAERIAERLSEREIDTLPKDLACASSPLQSSLEKTDLVVIVAAIRYGKILPEARDFLAAYQKLETKPKLVFLVVNLTSRKPGKETPEGSVYIRKAIKQYELAPVFARAIPGRARLQALYVARQAAHPVHHVYDGRADRSQDQHRVYAVGCRGRYRSKRSRNSMIAFQRQANPTPSHSEAKVSGPAEPTRMMGRRWLMARPFPAGKFQFDGSLSLIGNLYRESKDRPRRC